MFELTGGFRVGDVIWYGSLGPDLLFKIVSIHKDLVTGDEGCQAEVVQSPYAREDRHEYYVGAIGSLASPAMYRLVERDVLTLDWMRREHWNLGRLTDLLTA